MVAPVDLAVRQTVQKLPEANKVSTLQYFATGREELLPRWGTRRREMVLRAWERHPRNSMAQSAIRNAIIRILATPWEVKGPPEEGEDGGIKTWQDFLRDMQFGQGWSIGMGAFFRDYFRHDIGAFMEVIGPGNPSGPMTGEPTGMAYLDAMRCTPTGDPKYPVIYQGKDNTRHVMHRDRVFRMVDMPDSDENYPGPIGLCGVSRLISIIQREVLMGRYVEAFLDDKPKPGILLGQNMSEEQWNSAVARYRETIGRDDMGEWGKTIFVSGMAIDQAINLVPISFNEAPEKFDYKVYTVEIDAPMMANALGVDVQDIWPQQQKLGSGTTAEIMHAKGSGRTFGFLLQQSEREINDTLPEEYEFQFKYRDEQQDRERADNAQVWVSITQTLSGSVMSEEEKRQLLANMVEPIRDVITDETGQIVRLDDADPQPNPIENLIGALDTDEGTAPEAGEQAIADDTENPESKQPVPPQKAYRFKDYDTTRTQFVILLQNAIEVAQGGMGSPGIFAVQLREMLRNYSRTAYGDGLEAGGVNRADMDERDDQALRQWLVEQSAYVTNFSKRVYAGEYDERAARVHAEMWANKSLRGAYNLGKASAAWNVPHTWQLGLTEEHCLDCLRLNGQTHRMRDWRTRGWYPGSSQLECGGYHCDCRLNPAPGMKAQGRY